MRKVTTILCSIAFMVSGIMMAITASDPSPGNSYKTVAATTPKMYIPTFPELKADTGTIDLSEDLLRDLAKKKGVLDTVYITKTDTIKEQVTKVKWRKAPAPTSVVKRDTIQVPVYYLATQVETKEDSTGQCIPVYELRKVDELCTGTKTSSVEDVNEHHIKGDD